MVSNEMLDHARHPWHTAGDMEHSPSTGSQRHADLLLTAKGSSLREYLATKRAEGLSYEQIARDLYSDTDGEVSLSYATIKRWLIDFDLTEAAS